MDFILNLLILIVILGVIVFVHEFGHFIAAKKSGVYVSEFAIGMGPKLFSFKRKNDETEYTLRLLPLGGFNAMATGEEKIKGVKESQKLENKSHLSRFFVLILGVIMNFVLTIVLLIINGLIYGSPNTDAMIGEVLLGSPSDTAGLKSGDVITNINGVNISSWDDAVLEIQYKDVETYKITVLRDNKEVNLEITPNITKNENGETTKSFGFTMGESKSYGLVNAIKYGFTGSLKMTKSIFVVLKNLVTGGIGVDNLSGPVGIFTVIDQIKESGFESIIYLTAYLSLNVGIINLIPLPVFDGGRILLLIVEKIKGKALNPKIENTLNTIGFFLLVILMIYVTLNDILKLF